MGNKGFNRIIIREDRTPYRGSIFHFKAISGKLYRK